MKTVGIIGLGYVGLPAACVIAEAGFKVTGIDMIAAPVGHRAENAAVEFDDYRRGDIRFHIAVAQATGVGRLVSLMTEVQGEISELIAHIAHPNEVLTHSNAEHLRIVEALERRDGPGAVRLLRRHLEGTEHILAGLMR